MDAKKNIIIIGSAHPLRGGGIASFNERLARAFQSDGHEVNIYTFSLQYPGFLFPGSTQYSTEPAPADLQIHIAINSVNPLNWISVGNKIRSLRPDIVVVRYWMPFMGPCLGTILRIIKKNRHTRIICIADNVVPHEPKLYDKPFTKYFIKPVDAFITMSEKVLADLRTFTSSAPAVYVPHPLYDSFGEKISRHEARAKLGIDQDIKLMLFFGFIRKYKGLDILLDAMKILKERGVAAKLLVAGEFYEDRNGFDEQIEKLGINDNLILRTDFIKDSEVKYFLCAADVVIQPYRNATQSGVTPLAYHFEIPMIVTNVGGLPSMVPPGVGLIAEPNAESIAEEIQTFFSLPSSSFVSNIIVEKKKYSWEKMVKTILEF